MWHLYVLKCSVKLRSLHFVSPSEKYVSTSCMRNQTSHQSIKILESQMRLAVILLRLQAEQTSA